MQRRLLAAIGMLLCALSLQAKEIRIAHVYDRTGPLETYARQTQTGLMMGLEYATGGTMQVNGRDLVVLEKDSQGKPELGRALLAQAYAEDKADIAVGPTSSGVALAMLPVAAEHRRLLLVEPAVADAITGEKWNRYIFRTSRNSSQDAISNAVVLDRDNVSIAILAQDSAFGRDGVKAFRNALRYARLVHEEYLPPGATDIAAGAQRLFAALKDKPGRKVIFVIWAGPSPVASLADLDPKRFNIEVAAGGNTLPAMTQFSSLPGMQGATYYYFGFPRNKANMWLVLEHYKRYKSPPDFFTAGGMAAGIAIVEALRKTSGDTATEKLIAGMEGLKFDTPKGPMVFRKEDHQAMQSMYHFRVSRGTLGGVPDLYLVREIMPEEIEVPITNRR